MAALAVSLGPVDRPARLRAAGVFPARHDLKVRRIDTEQVVASMVDGQPGWNCSDGQRVSQAVR